MMSRVLIADDERLAREKLRGFLASVDWVDLISETMDGPGTRHAIDTLKPDLVFLDIRMPGASGMEVLDLVKHMPHIIFTTAYDQYAVAAFELQAVDYLLKPFGKARFHKALARARQTLVFAPSDATALQRMQRVLKTPAPAPLSRLFVRSRNRIMPLPVDQIERLEAHNDYVMLYAGKQRHLIHLRMKDFEERLDHRFIRVHRSHLINLDYIATLTPYDHRRLQIRMQDGTTIIASRAGSKVLRQLVI